MIVELTEHERESAKLRDEDKDELVRSIRALCDRVQDLYRPIRDSLSSQDQLTDPDWLGLCATRDNLIAAETSILRINDGRRAKEAASAE